ncbi:MAG: tRNA G18 (ribose-2'-O)-methylase SpoU [Myxococcota bacterium]|jgi:tRNA G18 (ribose-2'-O)-methylase SpoU
MSSATPSPALSLVSTPARFQQLRHKPGLPLVRPRELVVACVPMRSNVNLSQIARAASACAVDRMILCGNARLIDKIARDSDASFEVERRRSLAPVLIKMAAQGYRIVGLEQATGSTDLLSYRFDRRTVLVVGNERLGISQDILDLLDDVVEIPVWGRPHSHNAATAANMAIYEYCRQFPGG